MVYVRAKWQKISSLRGRDPRGGGGINPPPPPPPATEQPKKPSLVRVKHKTFLQHLLCILSYLHLALLPLNCSAGLGCGLASLVFSSGRSTKMKELNSNLGGTHVVWTSKYQCYRLTIVISESAARETSISMMTLTIPFHASSCWIRTEWVQQASEHGLGSKAGPRRPFKFSNGALARWTHTIRIQRN